MAVDSQYRTRCITKRELFVIVLFYFFFIYTAHAESVFNTRYFKYKQDILLPPVALVATSTILITVNLPYTLTTLTNNLKDVRIVDQNQSLIPYTIHNATLLPQRIILPILDWVELDGKSITTLDMSNDPVHKRLFLDLQNATGSGTVSLFGASEYYGLYISSWVQLLRNIPVSFESIQELDYSESHYKYLMAILTYDSSNGIIHMKRILGDNPHYEERVEKAYVHSDISGVGSSTNITIDRGTSASQHFALGLPSGQVETSPDNNHWTFRGLTTGYEPTTDRFIRAVISKPNTITSKLIEIRSMPISLTFQANPKTSYTLYYGNLFAQAPKETSTSTDQTLEAKLGVQEDNPSYNNPASEITTDSSPYAEPILFGLLSLAVLYIVIKVLKTS